MGYMFISKVDVCVSASCAFLPTAQGHKGFGLEPTNLQTLSCLALFALRCFLKIIGWMVWPHDRRQHPDMENSD